MSRVRRAARPYGLVAIVAGASLSAVAAAAALGGLGITGLGSGSAAVAGCDADGFTVTHVLSGSLVTAVTLGDIHADCATGQIAITLTDVTDAVIATGGPVVVPGGGGMTTLTLNTSPDSSAFSSHHIRIIGP